jgi:hypothetical protein
LIELPLTEPSIVSVRVVPKACGRPAVAAGSQARVAERYFFSRDVE